MRHPYSKREKVLLGKKIDKERHMRSWGHYAKDWDVFVELTESSGRYYSDYYKEYWRVLYLSGCRKYAKDCSNAVLRSKLKNSDDSFRGATCNKVFDYFYTIW